MTAQDLTVEFRIEIGRPHAEAKATGLLLSVSSGRGCTGAAQGPETGMVGLERPGSRSELASGSQHGEVCLGLTMLRLSICTLRVVSVEALSFYSTDSQDHGSGS